MRGDRASSVGFGELKTGVSKDPMGAASDEPATARVARMTGVRMMAGW